MSSTLKQPLFSVIVPVYNVEQYLAQCLDSVVQQSFQDYEVIIVNDATTDDSETVIRPYVKEYHNFKYLKLEQNVGLGYARNVGMEQAEGKYVFFLDADDWIENDALETLATLLNNFSDSDVDLILFNHKMIHDGNAYPNLSDKTYSNFESDREYLADKDVLFKIFHVAWNKLYRLEFISKNQLAFPQGAYEDIPFVLQAYSLTDQIVLTSSSLYNYRLREGTSLGAIVKKSHRNDHFVIFSRYQAIFDGLSEEQLKPEMATRIIRHMLRQCVAILVNKYRLKNDQRKSFSTQTIQALEAYDIPYNALSITPYRQLKWLVKKQYFLLLKFAIQGKYFINKLKLLKSNSI